MKRIKNFFGSKKTKEDSGASTGKTINGLREMEEMLTKKQEYFEAQVQNQISLARKHGLKNKRAALLALKRKRRLEQQLLQVDGTLTTIELQREALETAKNNVAVLQAMKAAAATLKDAQMHLDADKVHDIMDDISEQQEVAKEIADAISSPIGFNADIDDSELEKELDELEQEELDKELLQVEPALVQSPSFNRPGRPSQPILNTDGPGTSQTGTIKPVRSRTEEDKELEKLAEWASA